MSWTLGRQKWFLKKELKLTAFKKHSIAQNMKEVKTLLNHVNYYRRFTKILLKTFNAPDRAHRKSVFSLKSMCTTSFESIKSVLCSVSVFVHFSLDAEVLVATHASNCGVGAVIEQPNTSGVGFVANAAKTLNSAKSKLCGPQRRIACNRRLTPTVAHIFASKKFLSVYRSPSPKIPKT